MSGRARAIDIAIMAATPLALVLCAAYHVKASALLTLVVGIASVLVLLVGWERSRPVAEQIVPIVVFSSLACAGRVAFAAIPNVQPVTAICIISGCVLGARPGFMVGASCALLSNCLLGQGPWTPWQMYAWGAVGYASGAIFFRKASASDPRRFAICAFGFAASYAFGAIMDTWTLVGFTREVTLQSALVVYGAGVAFNLAHAISTVAFLAVLYVPWSKKMLRYRDRLDPRIVANDNSVV